MIGRTNSAGVMPVGTINITENGTYAISSFSQAIVSVSGLVPSGTLEISSNGTYDVTSYAGASVNVQGGGDFPYDDFDILIGGGPGSVYSNYCPSIIKNYAFFGQSALTEFVPVFSSTWLSIQIRYSAFYNCQNLTNVPFLSNSTFKSIGYAAFQLCSKLSNPLVNATNVDGFAFYNTKVPYYSVVAPESNITIGGSAFANCASLSSVYISCYNLTLNMNCFSSTALNSLVITTTSSLHLDCAYFLSRVTLANLSLSNLTSVIGPYTFAYANIQNLALSRTSGFTGARLYNYAFAYNNTLQTFSYYLNTSDTTTLQFSRGCFMNCYSLTSFDIRNLGNSAAVKTQMGSSYIFASCSSLLSFTYPILSYVGSSCFFSCTNFRFFKHTDFGSYNHVYPATFMNCYKLSYFYTRQLQGVLNQAFYNCSSLKSVVMYRPGNYGYTVYGDAFFGCTAMESLYIFGDTVATLYNAFSSCTFTDSTYLGYYGSIYVLSSLVSAYQTATNWAALSERFVGIDKEDIQTIIDSFENTQYSPPEE